MNGTPSDKDQSTGSPASTTTEPDATANPEAKDLANAKKVWRNDRDSRQHDRPNRDMPLGDALSMGAGQVSSPYLTEVQADAIAKQTNRDKNK